jgi:hypothetical protein
LHFSAGTYLRCSCRDVTAAGPAGIAGAGFMLETTRWKNEEKRYG